MQFILNNHSLTSELVSFEDGIVLEKKVAHSEKDLPIDKDA